MRLLIVEDDVDVRKLLTTACSKLGHTVVALEDGVDVFHHALGTYGAPPDVIVLDFHLPKLSGDKVMAQLSKDAATRHIPVVVYSASPRLALASAVQHKNASYVQKGRLRELFKELERLDVVTTEVRPHPISNETAI